MAELFCTIVEGGDGSPHRYYQDPEQALRAALRYTKRNRTGVAVAWCRERGNPKVWLAHVTLDGWRRTEHWPAAYPPVQLPPTPPGSANRYRTTLRPASFGGMPPGVRWQYVEAPSMHGITNRPDLPISRHRYGVVCTERPLTTDEMRHFDIVKDS